MNILIFIDFNLINSVVLLIFLIISIIHFFKTISLENENSNQISLHMNKYWSFFLVLVSLVALMRYSFQFLAFDLIYERTIQQPSFQYTKENSKIIGLIIHETICFEEEKNGNVCVADQSKLRNGVLPDVLLLFLTLMVKSYLRMIIIFEKNDVVRLFSSSKKLTNNTNSSLIKIPKNENNEIKMNLKMNSKSFEILNLKKASALKPMNHLFVNSPWRIIQKKYALQRKQSVLKQDYLMDLNRIFEEYINYPLSSM